MERYDVCIIGGGASGLAAAASLEKGIKTCILDKNRILGRKILATGGGRCNITNRACENRHLTLDFFRSMGLELYSDSEGRYYPYTNQASDVVKALTDAVEGKNTDVITEFNVLRVKKKNGIFYICGKDRTVTAEKLILAAGGKAAPALGTTGDGYAMAKTLGHTVTRVYPVLTGIECGDMKAVKGVRAKGTVRLYRDDMMVAEETGEIQFNENGISGICVMNITLHIRAQEGENIREALKRFHISLDLAPDFSEKELAERKSSFGILTDRLAAEVPVWAIKKWRLPVLGVKGWKNAQCTAGGVRLDEIERESSHSRICEGLYITGELLDFQERCGGFNLQNAWETGIAAASHINSCFKK